MVEDARFEDGQELPLHLKVQDAEDLAIVSALLQDAVLPMKETSWQPDANRFGMLVNRFRWEDKTHAENSNRPYERVQSMLVIDNVQNVSSMGIDHTDKDQIISILSVEYDADKVTFTLAGDGALALDVECLDITIKDVTKPYAAASKSAPSHNLD
ncbi:MAG: DUF2948 family protein [Proteobacteria bacterium]|nr:DUF2948 family protein [Pseudomonadota bacterium]